MNEMVERVARALCVEHYGRGADQGDGWENQIGEARAAIAAMREPTEAMVSAASEAYASDTWRDMIDAALEDEP